MSNLSGSGEPVRLLSRFHNSTVLRKYGSSQKGLRTRKKKRKEPSLYQSPKPLFIMELIVLWASTTTALFKCAIKTTNIITLFWDTLGIAVPWTLHWLPNAVAIAILFLYFVCKCASTCTRIFLYRLVNTHDVMLRNITSLNQCHIVTDGLMDFFVLIFLPCTSASPMQVSTVSENKNTAIILAAAL